MYELVGGNKVFKSEAAGCLTRFPGEQRQDVAVFGDFAQSF